MTVGVLGSERRDELDGVAVDRSETDRVEAEPRTPVEVRPPRRGVEDHPRPETGGELEVGVVVAAERIAPVVGGEQRERGEVGEIDALVEHERRLEAAVHEERLLGGELGKGVHGVGAFLAGRRSVSDRGCLTVSTGWREFARHDVSPALTPSVVRCDRRPHLTRRSTP